MKRVFVIRSIIIAIAIILVVLLSIIFYWQNRNHPSTSMGIIDTYVVNLAPRVSGPIKTVNVTDNQLVHKGEVLAQIDPTLYKLQVAQAQASVNAARVALKNAQYHLAQSTRAGAYVSEKTRKDNLYKEEAAVSALTKANAALALAKQNLIYTAIVSPGNGHITNLHVTTGSYATQGQPLFALVSNHYWAYGFFKETELSHIHVSDQASIKLMGSNEVLRGHVESIGYGILRSDIQIATGSLPKANPVQNWVRLAQRVPVKIQLDVIPKDLHLFVGQTAYIALSPSPKK